jgi:hypothetical protein
MESSSKHQEFKLHHETVMQLEDALMTVKALSILSQTLRCLQKFKARLLRKMRVRMKAMRAKKNKNKVCQKKSL